MDSNKSYDSPKQSFSADGSSYTHATATRPYSPFNTTPTNMTRPYLPLTPIFQRNRPIVIMIFAQILSSIMATTSKILQTSPITDAPLSTLQVLLTMQTTTLIFSQISIAILPFVEAISSESRSTSTTTPQPTSFLSRLLGPSDLWPLLHARGISGVFGIGGFYYSLRYLPLSEATVINFLAPMVAAAILALLLNQRWRIAQQVAGGVSILGVVCVGQPWRVMGAVGRDSVGGGAGVGVERDMRVGANFTASVLNNATEAAAAATVAAAMKLGSEGGVDYMVAPEGVMDGGGASMGMTHMHTTSLQQASAIAAALVGVLGGAGAFVTMTKIGKRAHPLVTVHYFAAWAVVLSALALAVTGLDALRMPSFVEWFLMVCLGLFGLGLQGLMTYALAGEGGGRALNMVYTQIVFALIMDKIIWGVSPNWMGFLGGGLIMGSVIAVAAMNDDGSEKSEKLRRNEEHEEEEIEMMVPKEVDEGL